MAVSLLVVTSEKKRLSADEYLAGRRNPACDGCIFGELEAKDAPTMSPFVY
jgi:hypothetical protein